MWLSVIHFLSSASAPYLFCGVIFVAFAYALIDGWARLSVVRIAITRALGILESAGDTEGFYTKFKALGDQFAGQPVFASPWSEFSKTVVLDNARLLVRITRRPEAFFHAQSLIAPRINLRLYTAMPGYLISLGLFFTFIGLVAAIAIAAQGLTQGADSARMQEALVLLLNVASLKFVSSITGIFLSIVLSFVQKSWMNGLHMRIHQFCASVEKRTQLVTTEQLLYQWLLAQEQTTRGYARLAEDIATEVTLQLQQGA